MDQDLEWLGRRECYHGEVDAIRHFESSFERDNEKFRVMGTLNLTNHSEN